MQLCYPGIFPEKEKHAHFILMTSPTSRQPSAESPLSKFVVSGVVSWIFELSLGHPLELLKITRQTTAKSYFTIFAEITKHKGIGGVWDGFFPWGSLQAIVKGGVFGWGHAFARHRFDTLVSDRVAEVLASSVGGACQGVVLSPLLLLKTRVITDPAFRTSGGMLSTALRSCTVGVRIVRNEGMSSLMKGSLLFTVKRVADWTTRFAFVELAEIFLLKRHPKESSLSMAEKSVASLLGGAISAFVTLPIDGLVSQSQQASNAGKKVSSSSVYVHHYNNGGIKQVFLFATRGFLPRVLHVAGMTLAMKTISSMVYQAYYSVSTDSK